MKDDMDSNGPASGDQLFDREHVVSFAEPQRELLEFLRHNVILKLDHA